MCDPAPISKRATMTLSREIGVASWDTSIPIVLAPDIKRPSGGNAIFVFALPESSTTLRK